MDLNGLEIGKVYTKQQVIDIMGEPRAYRRHDSEFGLDESYYYGERTELDFQHDGEFFFLYCARFEVCNFDFVYKRGNMCWRESVGDKKSWLADEKSQR